MTLAYNKGTRWSEWIRAADALDGKGESESKHPQLQKLNSLAKSPLRPKISQLGLWHCNA